jgi:hypothetical protein
MAKDLAECLKLQTESDGLEGYLVVHPGYDPQDVTAEILRIQLQATGVISSWIDKKALKDISARSQGDPDTVHRALSRSGLLRHTGWLVHLKHTNRFDSASWRFRIVKSLSMSSTAVQL